MLQITIYEEDNQIKSKYNLNTGVNQLQNLSFNRLAEELYSANKIEFDGILTDTFDCRGKINRFKERIGFVYTESLFGNLKVTENGISRSMLKEYDVEELGAVKWNSLSDGNRRIAAFLRGIGSVPEVLIFKGAYSQWKCCNHLINRLKENIYFVFTDEVE